ncbi:MAG: 50S ribosomal protein L6 [Deltaproteobacteria bacterium]|nr:50S ribosomal protein L6 [Candidatus Tharpella aukensis]
MSRIGKKEILLPQGVDVSVADGVVKVKGPKGSLQQVLVDRVGVDVNGQTVNVTRVTDDRRSRSLHGLMRALLANMVTGVSEGFSKSLEIKGIGYKAAVKGSTLDLALGFSHPIAYPIPDGITISVEKEKVLVQGIDKQLVGAVAADIRSFRPVEPYKGKGIKYTDEYVIRKAGKAGK